MFFTKNPTERVNQRTHNYIGQVATISRDVSYGRGRAVMEDRTIWCVLCDYDIMANAKVIVVDVVDKMSLKVKPFYHP
jgi:membrane protein implicated in regulation of membrane protease activity